MVEFFKSFLPCQMAEVRNTDSVQAKGARPSPPRAMKAFVFAVLVLVVFNLILFFKLVIAPGKSANPANPPPPAGARQP